MRNAVMLPLPMSPSVKRTSPSPASMVRSLAPLMLLPKVTSPSAEMVSM